MSNGFYVIPQDEAKVMGIISQFDGSSNVYPEAFRFQNCLREAARYTGISWNQLSVSSVTGRSFLNCMEDLCPDGGQGQQLLRMYLMVSQNDADEWDSGLGRMLRYGRTSLGNAVYLLGSLAAVFDRNPFSSEMVEKAALLFRPYSTLASNSGISGHLKDCVDARTDRMTLPPELRYSIEAMRRILRSSRSGTIDKRTLSNRLHEEYQIAPAEADALASSYFQQDIRGNSIQVACEKVLPSMNNSTGDVNLDNRSGWMDTTSSWDTPDMRHDAPLQQPDNSSRSYTLMFFRFVPWILLCVLALVVFLNQRSKSALPYPQPHDNTDETSPHLTESTDKADKTDNTGNTGGADNTASTVNNVNNQSQSASEMDDMTTSRNAQRPSTGDAYQDFINGCSDWDFQIEDFYGFDKEKYLRAINSIYAHAGRIFGDRNKELREYYEQFDWYQPRIEGSDFHEAYLNGHEVTNLYRLLEYGIRAGYRSVSEEDKQLATFINLCSSSYFDSSDLSALDSDMTFLAWNAIYAKAGWKFESDYLRAYFSQFDWYQPVYSPEEFHEGLLNDCQKFNRVILHRFDTEKNFTHPYGEIERYERNL